MHPLVGGVAGGAVVTVHGSGLAGTSPAWARCAFGEAAVPARQGMRGALECTSPRPRAAGYVPLEVTADGHTYSAGGAQFEYLAAARVRSVEPSAGPVAGGTFVNVSGGGFARRAAQLGYLACRFNATVSAAAWRAHAELQSRYERADAAVERACGAALASSRELEGERRRAAAEEAELRAQAAQAAAEAAHRETALLAELDELASRLEEVELEAKQNGNILFSLSHWQRAVRASAPHAAPYSSSAATQHPRVGTLP